MVTYGSYSKGPRHNIMINGLSNEAAILVARNVLEMEKSTPEQVNLFRMSLGKESGYGKVEGVEISLVPPIAHEHEQRWAFIFTSAGYEKGRLILVDFLDNKKEANKRADLYLHLSYGSPGHPHETAPFVMVTPDLDLKRVKRRAEETKTPFFVIKPRSTIDETVKDTMTAIEALMRVSADKSALLKPYRAA